MREETLYTRYAARRENALISNWGKDGEEAFSSQRQLRTGSSYHALSFPPLKGMQQTKPGPNPWHRGLYSEI